MTPDMERGAARHGDAPSTISSPPLGTDETEDNARPLEVEGDDLGAVLDEVFSGDVRHRERPSLLALEDHPGHVGLFYRHRVNWLAGSTETGKSWAACILVARALVDGQDVAYLDCESDATDIVGRLRDLGVDRDDIKAGLTYRRPHNRAEWNTAVGELLALELDVAVIDGVLEALRLTGANANDTNDLADWVRDNPAHLARTTRAGVLCVDHTARDGGLAGSFHKLRTVSGAAYTLEAEQRIGLGRRGVIALRVAKDRHGGLHARTGQVVGRIVLDSTAGDGRIDWAVVRDSTAVRAPSATESAEPALTPAATPAERPEELMAAVARALEVAGEPLSSNKVLGLVTGTAANVRRALALLVDEGHVARDQVTGRGNRPTHLHRFLKPYPPGVARAAASPPPLRGVGGATTQAAATSPTHGPTHADARPTHATQGASEDHDARPTHGQKPTHALAVVR